MHTRLEGAPDPPAQHVTERSQASSSDRDSAPFLVMPFKSYKKAWLWKGKGGLNVVRSTTFGRKMLEAIMKGYPKVTRQTMSMTKKAIFGWAQGVPNHTSFKPNCWGGPYQGDFIE